MLGLLLYWTILNHEISVDLGCEALPESFWEDDEVDEEMSRWHSSSLPPVVWDSW